MVDRGLGGMSIKSEKTQEARKDETAVVAGAV